MEVYAGLMNIENYISTSESEQLNKQAALLILDIASCLLTWSR